MDDNLRYVPRCALDVGLRPRPTPLIFGLRSGGGNPNAPCRSPLRTGGGEDEAAETWRAYRIGMPAARPRSVRDCRRQGRDMGRQPRQDLLRRPVGPCLLWKRSLNCAAAELTYTGYHIR
jgi:hypothetical protein